MAKIVLITGGARSGKSSFALQCAHKSGYARKAFIATACATDAEMQRRIEAHRKERGESFVTIEESFNLVTALRSVTQTVDVAVIDCLTVWLGNLFFQTNNDERAVKNFIDALCMHLPVIPCDAIFITNEVGCGIVPENELARAYRDMCGYMNRIIAERAHEVYACVCGIPVKIKG